MTQLLRFQKSKFIQNFLTPISKLVDNAALTVTPSSIYSICNSQNGNNVVLYAQYLNTENSEFNGTINIPDIKKFIRLLECIESDSIELTIVSNHVKYQDENFKFKYFLLEDGIVAKSSIKIEKLEKLAFNTTCELTSSKFSEILKGSSIATDSDKLYWYTTNGCVHAELNDRERQNINSICYQAADSYEGTDITDPILTGLENIRLMAGLKTDKFQISFNTAHKIVLFQYKDIDTDIRFFVPGLVR